MIYAFSRLVLLEEVSSVGVRDGCLCALR
eukprot:COSAG06_NODE_69689_length_196_cov_48.752577_1_plen_28_part_01